MLEQPRDPSYSPKMPKSMEQLLEEAREKKPKTEPSAVTERMPDTERGAIMAETERMPEPPDTERMVEEDAPSTLRAAEVASGLRMRMSPEPEMSVRGTLPEASGVEIRGNVLSVQGTQEVSSPSSREAPVELSRRAYIPPKESGKDTSRRAAA